MNAARDAYIARLAGQGVSSDDARRRAARRFPPQLGLWRVQEIARLAGVPFVAPQMQGLASTTPSSSKYRFVPSFVLFLQYM